MHSPNQKEKIEDSHSLGVPLKLGTSSTTISSTASFLIPLSPMPLLLGFISNLYAIKMLYLPTWEAK